MLEVVEQTQRRSKWPLEPILACLGVPRSVYFSWRARAEEGPLAETPRGPTSYDRLLPDEVEAIKEFALRHPKTGYRKLTYMMLDQDIACASESAVYRVLREADLLRRWKRSARSSGVYSFKPTGPNQQWHSDVSAPQQSSIGDEGTRNKRPLATGLQEQVANHRKRLGSKAPVVSVAEKASEDVR